MQQVRVRRRRARSRREESPQLWWDRQKRKSRQQKQRRIKVIYSMPTPRDMLYSDLERRFSFHPDVVTIRCGFLFVEHSTALARDQFFKS